MTEVNYSLLSELPQAYLNNKDIPSYFPPDRIFVVYGHSGESVQGRGNKTLEAVERAEQQFARLRIPSDTFTANTVPAALAAPAIPIETFYSLLNAPIEIPNVNKSLQDYKNDIQKLGKKLYASSILNSDQRFIMAISLKPSPSDLFYMAPKESKLGQEPWERFRTHGPRHPSARENVKDDLASAYFLFSQPKNKIDVFTAQSANIKSGCSSFVSKIGTQWSPSGAMRITELRNRFPQSRFKDPFFLQQLFDNYTFGQIRDDFNKCVSSLIGTNKEAAFKGELIIKSGDMSSANRNLHDLLLEQIELVKKYIVWDILPIPGTDIILTEKNFYDCKIKDLYNKAFDSETILKYIRQAAGPGPLLVIFHHCRSFKIKDDGEYRNNSDILDPSAPAVSQRQAILNKFSKPLLARTLSNRGQGFPGGGSRKKLKHGRKSNTTRQRR
jgi:hypothetical protein